MPKSLLDINVLLALIWSHHGEHDAANRWFQKHRKQGWATCPLTQSGFVRISMQPAVVSTALPLVDALEALKLNVAAGDHEFWPLDYPLSEMQPVIRERIRGAKQVTDAILLDLAIRRNGRLITFDRRLSDLLPPKSPMRSGVVVIDSLH